MISKTCFVICPLDRRNSRVRHRSDQLLKHIIEPVVCPLGFEVTRGDLVQDEKTIPDSISAHIFNDYLVIADLTDCNPNVFYELGKRHAWGGRCIHFTQDISSLPFDLSHHRVIEYSFDDPETLENARRKLRVSIQALDEIPTQCPYPLTPEKVVELSNATVVIEREDGHREHYYLAKRMAEVSCKRIFLMQRSSTLILGPEQGWEAERSFYHALLQQVAKGVELFHIVSLEGIVRHRSRPRSSFLETRWALSNLDHSTENVGISGPERAWYFKRVLDEEEDADLKPDRQARTFVVELTDGTTEGVIVVDLGGMQSCFRMRGSKMRDFLRSCIDFYDRCHYLKWVDLEMALRD